MAFADEDETIWIWDRDVETAKRILLNYIRHNGIFAPMEPEHFHRIRMMKLDLVEAQIARDVTFSKKELDDELENFEEQLKNYKSWARFMRTVGTDNHPYTNRVLIGFINDQIEETEFTISVYKGATRR